MDGRREALEGFKDGCDGRKWKVGRAVWIDVTVGCSNWIGRCGVLVLLLELEASRIKIARHWQQPGTKNPVDARSSSLEHSTCSPASAGGGVPLQDFSQQSSRSKQLDK